jgi:DNA-binding transcriptional ArsR family regulator
VTRAQQIAPALSDEVLSAIAQRFRLLGEPQRLRLLHALEPGELSVSELCERTASSQPNVSKHLAVLFQGGLISRRKFGNNVLYSIADPVVFKLCRLVCRASSEHDERQATALRKAAQSFQKK